MRSSLREAEGSARRQAGQRIRPSFASASPPWTAPIGRDTPQASQKWIWCADASSRARHSAQNESARAPPGPAEAVRSAPGGRLRPHASHPPLSGAGCERRPALGRSMSRVTW